MNEFFGIPMGPLAIVLVILVAPCWARSAPRAPKPDLPAARSPQRHPPAVTHGPDRARADARHDDHLLGPRHRRHDEPHDP